MTKGYWLSKGSINEGEEMQPYLKSLQGWLPAVNRKFFAKDLATIGKERNPYSDLTLTIFEGVF